MKGGKGSWGGLLDVDDSHSLDPNNPTFDSSEPFHSLKKISAVYGPGYGLVSIVTRKFTSALKGSKGKKQMTIDLTPFRD
uniref:Uncharacterized protein n=1 Tax=Salix viminalis TaxID=40686 RepID=A0A6N2KWM7_SALVM